MARLFKLAVLAGTVHSHLTMRFSAQNVSPHFITSPVRPLLIYDVILKIAHFYRLKLFN